MLLTAGADVNAGARDTPLHAASARRLGAKIVPVLLDLGQTDETKQMSR